MMTIGGGYIIDPLPAKHRRNRPQVIERLKRLEKGDPGERVQNYLEEAGDYGLTASNLSVRTGLDTSQIKELLDTDELACISLATISFPTPLSPVMSTVDGVCAILLISFLMLRSTSLSPIRSPFKLSNRSIYNSFCKLVKRLTC